MNKKTDARSEKSPHMQTEDTLREIEAAYFALIRNPTVGILFRDECGIIAFTNETFAQMIQADKPSEILGLPYLDFVHPEDRAESIRRIASNLAGAVAHKREHRLIGLHGRTIIVESTGMPITKGGRPCVIGIFQDITQRRQAEDAVRAAEARYRALVDQSFEALALIDIQAQEVVEMNRRFTELFGYSLPEDAPLYLNKFVVDTPSNLEKLYETLEHQRRLPTETRIFRHKNGAEMSVERAATLINIDGRDYNWASMRDMTEERRQQNELCIANQELTAMNEEFIAMNEDINAANDRLREFNDRLQSENAERIRAENELKEAYAELKNAQAQIIQQEKLASIGQLAAGVAHEINNPMGFIISNLASLKKYTDKITAFCHTQDEIVSEMEKSCSDEREKEKIAILFQKLQEAKRLQKIDYIMSDLAGLVQETMDGADRVKTIVLDLKGFARITDEGSMLADINAGIESTINIIWNELKYKTTIVKEYGNIPLTKCNQGQLNQVFMNILMNAAQAIETQGEVRIKTWAEDGNIFVSIEDTGRGMPSDVINRIFEPFFTTKEVGKGTGLGLSVSYEIIKKHGGEIKVGSELGKGTTFTVKIPIVTE